MKHSLTHSMAGRTLHSSRSHKSRWLQLKFHNLSHPSPFCLGTSLKRRQNVVSVRRNSTLPSQVPFPRLPVTTCGLPLVAASASEPPATEKGILCWQSPGRRPQLARTSDLRLLRSWNSSNRDRVNVSCSHEADVCELEWLWYRCH
jgi:hypothetical protein